MVATAALEGWLADWAHLAPTVFRVGLGVVVLLEGVHKLLVPEVWGAYAAPWVLALWPAPMPETMVATGLAQVGFAVAIAVDRFTSVAALVLALLVSFVVVNLLTAGPATGAFLDVAIRDVGLVVLSLGVALQSASGAS